MPNDKFWQDKAIEVLQGKTIKKVQYITKRDAQDNLWNKRGLLILLDDDTLLTILSDDEGNDMGVIEYHRDKDFCGILPSLY